MAIELTRRLHYAEIVDAPSTDLNYYLNYSAYRSRHSKAEAAFFTHIEDAPEPRARFFNTAQSVDACICHSAPAQRVLASAGIANVHIIPPGVDLQKYEVRVRIGVVGRTYHTGRKGEALVAKVMDVPGVEWAFTGSGWPGRSHYINDDDLPAFYRSLDYLLVPSLQEGGPMSVVEALACGTPVIAPPVGWVSDYPHIEYRTGDADDLRRVLTEVVATKERLRASVAGRSWDVWAQKHDEVFRALVRKFDLASKSIPAGVGILRSIAKGLGLTPKASELHARTKIMLRSHGPERHSLGGPSVRMPILSKNLKEAGFRVVSEKDQHPDITHIFNAWSPETALEAIREAKAVGSRVVFSPIFLDLSYQALWEHGLLASLKHNPTSQDAAACFAEIRSLRALAQSSGSSPEPAPGYFANLREMTSLSDAVILLSEAERQLMLSAGAELPPLTKVVPNPANITKFEPDPSLFKRQFGLQDYVLSIGRLEPRKNQLALILAMRELDIPLVLVGHSTHPEYRRLIEMHRWSGLTIINRLDAGSPLLWSALAGARVFALPSWAEGGPLAALEAASAGCDLVLADGKGEREYFGNWATYVDPADPLALREALRLALNNTKSEGGREAQRQFFRKRYDWSEHVDLTCEVYASVAGKKASIDKDRTSRLASLGASLFLFDVTTLANHSGRWTGISRVEAQIARNLGAVLGSRLIFIAWHDRTEAFVPISAASVHAGTVRDELARHDEVFLPAFQSFEGGRLVVVGSAWMQNTRYALSVANFAERMKLHLTLVIHDCFPLIFPQWYDEKYAPIFRENLISLLSAASSVVTVSQATAMSLRAALGMGHAALSNLPIGVFREGDDFDASENSPVSESIKVALRNVPFVLAVGAIHSRKNYGLLQQVWLRLVQEMQEACPRLVIVGGVAWNGKETAEALTRDPRLNSRVQILDKVNDATLQWLYRSALMTVYPSFAEGWGLPAAESLRFGAICLASDLPSIVEISDSLIERLDPLDPVMWATRIRFYVNSAEARAATRERIRTAYKPHSWAEAAKGLVRAIENLADRERRSIHSFGAYALGTVVHLGRYGGPGFLQGAGWREPEAWGVAMKATRSALAFRLPESASRPLIVSMLLRVPDELRGSVVTISVGGTPAATWLLPDDRFATRYAFFESARDEPGLVEIELNAIAAGLGVCSLAMSLCHNVISVDAALGQLRVTSMFGQQVVGSAGRALIEAHEAPGYGIQLEIVVSPRDPGTNVNATSVVINGFPIDTYRVDQNMRTRFIANASAAVRAAHDPVIVDLIPHSIAGAPLNRDSLEIHSVRDVSSAAVQKRAIICNYASVINFDNVSRIAERLGESWQPIHGQGIKALAANVNLPLRVPSGDGSLGLFFRLQQITAECDAETELEVQISVLGKILLKTSVPNGEDHEVSIRLVADMIDEGGFVDLNFWISGQGTSGNLLIRGLVVQKVGVDLIGPVAGFPVDIALQETMSWPLTIKVPANIDADAGSAAPNEQHETTVDFTLGGNAVTISRNGWYAAESAGTWSDASRARVVVPLPSDAAGMLELSLEGRVYGTAWTGPASVIVLVNDTEQFEWTFIDDHFHWNSLDFYRPIKGYGNLDLTISRLKGISPKFAGAGDDERLLGVLVRKIRVRVKQS